MQELRYKHFERVSKSDYPTLRDSGRLRTGYLSLIKGLPPEDVALVSRQMNGLERIFADDSPDLDIFTAAEKATYQKSRELLESSVFQIDKTVWCFNDFLLPSNNFNDIGVFIHQHGIEHWGKAAFKGKDVLDCGAFIGDSLYVFSRIGARRIYCFEPSPTSCDDLAKTITLNNLCNCESHRLALSDTTGTALFSEFDQQTANRIVQRDTPWTKIRAQYEVPVTTLDAWAYGRDLDIGLIKVDIEGAEMLMLKGAEATVRKHRPIMLLSIYHTLGDYFGIKPLVESWDLGYTYRIARPVDGTILSETLLICLPD